MASKLADERYDKLSLKMESGFKLVDEKLDDLAIATKIGFDETAIKGEMLCAFWRNESKI